MHPFMFLCLSSLMIFALSAETLVRSFFARDEIYYWGHPDPEDQWLLQIETDHGELGISRAGYFVNDPDELRRGWGYSVLPPTGSPFDRWEARPNDHIDFKFAGFGLRYNDEILDMGAHSEEAVVVPLWLFLPAVVPPILWLRRRRNRISGFPVTADAE